MLGTKFVNECTQKKKIASVVILILFLICAVFCCCYATIVLPWLKEKRRSLKVSSRQGKKVMGPLRLEEGDDCAGAGGAGGMAVAY